MKKKILLISCTGMLGHQVLKVFENNKKFKIFATYRSKYKLKLVEKYNNNVVFFKLDVLNKSDLNNLKKKFFDYIINCAGIIKPHVDEKNKSSILNAIKVNSEFPHIISEIFPKSKIFQIATDCVFSGTKGNYTEDDFHNATDIYGKTKSLGEVKNNNFFNLRTSIIGKELDGKFSLIEWFLNSKKNSTLNGFDNHMWNGITTVAFANFVLTLINKEIKVPNFIHIIPKNMVTKFEMLMNFRKFFLRNDLKVNKVNAKVAINRTLNTKYSKLVFKIWKESKYKKIPSFKDMLKEIC